MRPTHTRHERRTVPSGAFPPVAITGRFDEAIVDASAFDHLSKRESEVLGLAANGLLDKEIGAELGVSLNTLRTYWTRIRGKVGEAPRIALATAYVESRRSGSTAGAEVATADWEVDFEHSVIVYHTADPNAPEIPVGIPRPLGDALGTFHPDDAPAIRSALQGVFDGSLNSFAYTARRITSRGVVPVSAFVQVVRDATGKALRLYGTRTTPIDARETAGGQGGAVGLWCRDVRTGEIWIDEGFKRIYGLDGSEPDLRQAIIDRNHPDDRELAVNYVAEMLALGQTHVRKTYRVLSPQGEYRWASADVYLEFEDGQPARVRGTVLVYPRG